MRFETVMCVFGLFALSCGERNIHAAESDAQPSKTYGWRGDGSGRYPTAAPSVEWDAEAKKNVLWSVKIGPGKFSSPSVCANKVFVLAEPSKLICLNADTGAVLWQKLNGLSELPAKPVEKPVKGSPGNVTPVPVCDGHFVYASFGSGVVACYDLDGQRQWIQYFDLPITSEYGRSGSPVLAGDKLLVSINHLIALDAKTGQVVWKNEKVPERFGTPVTTTIGGVDVAICPSGHVVRLKDGAILDTQSELQFASPVLNGSVAYFLGATTSAVEFTPKAPDSVQAKVLWKTDIDGTFYASLIHQEGVLFAVSNEGSFYALNAADGKVLFVKDIDIGNATGRDNLPIANLYPSLCFAGGKLFLSNDVGDTIVVEPGREYKEVRKNKVAEGSGGSMAFAGRRIFVRDGETLLCIGEK